MNSSTYKFTLDLRTTQSQVSLPVMLGDTARELHISLSDGGTPYHIVDGCLAMITISRPDKSRLEAFCPIEKNTVIKYKFTEYTAIREGVHDCQAILVDGDGEVLGTAKFSMTVSSRAYNSDDIVITDEDHTFIDEVLAKEAERQENEGERQKAYTKLLGTLEEAEKFIRAVPRLVTITLRASMWAGNIDPYAQIITIEGSTEYSKVDLLPDADVLTELHDKDIAFLTENEDGVITVYAIGEKPTKDYTMQAVIKEVWDDNQR